MGDYGQALDALVRLKPAIDAFFTAVMVNAEDQAVRSNRLSLLQEQRRGWSLMISVLAQRAASEGPRWTRAVEDQSASILEEISSELGMIMCSLARRPQ